MKAKKKLIQTIFIIVTPITFIGLNKLTNFSLGLKERPELLILIGALVIIAGLFLRYSSEKARKNQ